MTGNPLYAKLVRSGLVVRMSRHYTDDVGRPTTRALPLAIINHNEKLDKKFVINVG